MAEGIDPLELKIVVNKDTGQLEIFGLELKKIQKTGEESKSAMGKLGGEFQNLLGPVAALGTVVGVFHFLKEGAIAAEQQAESMRRLSFTLQMNGVDFAANEERIKSWAEEAKKVTRFSDDQYLTAFEKAAKVTKDVGAAHEIVRIAMGLSVKAGGSLEERISQVTTLMTGNQRAVFGLSREFGTLISSTDSAEVAIGKLQKQFAGTAEGEKSATAEAAKLRHEFEDIQKKAGSFAQDAIVGWYQFFSFVAKGWESVITAAVTGVTALTTILNPFATKGAGKQALNELKIGLDMVKDIWIDHNKKVKAEQEKAPPLKPGAGKQDIEELKKDLSDRLALIKADETAKLQLKNVSENDKIRIIKESESAQLALLNSNARAFAGKETELANAKLKIVQDAAIKIKAVEQKNIADRVSIQEAWVAKNRQMGAQVGDAARKTADTIASSFGTTFAKLIVEGGDTEKALKQMSIQIAEQVIADVIRIGIQKSIAEAVATAGIGLQTKEMIALGAATDKTLASAVALNIALI